jgi:N-acetylneuraminate synthase
MQTLVTETERAWHALGKVNYGVTENEKKSLIFRRSLYIVKDLEAGAELTRDNLRAIRPGLGLLPKYLDVLLGKRLAKSVKRGTPASWDLLA